MNKQNTNEIFQDTDPLASLGKCSREHFLDWWNGVTEPMGPCREMAIPQEPDRWVKVSFQTSYDSLLNDGLCIDSILATSPGYGDGTTVLKLICEKADEFGVALLLQAEGQEVWPSDGPDQGKIVTTFRRLKSWYERHGFVQREQHVSNAMIRHPQGRKNDLCENGIPKTTPW